jgi:hypothetical protein
MKFRHVVEESKRYSALSQHGHPCEKWTDFEPIATFRDLAVANNFMAARSISIAFRDCDYRLAGAKV